MKPFFIVGPTAAGKSEIAAEVAIRVSAEIVSADAFQLYDQLPILTAKPDLSTLARAPHHLIGTTPSSAEMSAARFGELAAAAFDAIRARGNNIVVAGGSGLYIRVLTEGLSFLPAADHALRAKLSELSLREQNAWLRLLDPRTADAVDAANPRRVVRALEICLLTGQPASVLRRREKPTWAAGVLLFRDRDDLYQRIDSRVERMFAEGVVEEVLTVPPLSATAQQTLGLREIRRLLAGEITERACIAAIQQATRRYAKRQLTWFSRQSNFEPLNLSERTTAEAIEWIARKARLSFAHD
ncbi:MAG: tRNA (adenosine(37)-N6)-dimethylallyltransferase MiaA [Verrucomicrobiota bacterium]|nr:tRNA (adenosine(37)-N6)-dimethylallyltransferase MiaA [Verrucomicrobiota bacterium]